MPLNLFKHSTRVKTNHEKFKIKWNKIIKQNLAANLLPAHTQSDLLIEEQTKAFTSISKAEPALLTHDCSFSATFRNNNFLTQCVLRTLAAVTPGEPFCVLWQHGRDTAQGCPQTIATTSPLLLDTHLAELAVHVVGVMRFKLGRISAVTSNPTYMPNFAPDKPQITSLASTDIETFYWNFGCPSKQQAG